MFVPLLLRSIPASRAQLFNLYSRHPFISLATQSLLARYTTMSQQQYKLKVESADLKNGQKVEAQIEGVDDVKVVLLKVNDQLRAIGSNCTHYGAPLVKGVVADDGRITCPWHGACFNTSTGDIENAPALDPIAAYPVTVKGKEVYITADEATLKRGSRTPNLACAAKQDSNVLIIGGGSGGIGAIEGLREKGYKGKITVLSKEAYLPIDRTKLSKALIPDKEKIQWRDDKFFKDAGVEFHLETEVDSVDFKGHTVTTKDGRNWDYNKIILATGGAPRSLPMEGFKKLGNIFVLRGIDDVQRILTQAGEGKKAVVIGASFIGLEVGNCLAGKKNDVTIVGMESAPMERVLGDKVGKIIQKKLESAGIKFRLNATIEDAKPKNTDPSKVGSVQLKGGETIEADFVVLGVGVAPATEYLKKSGVPLEKDGSVSVDNHWRIEGVEDAYAVGDIATYPYAYGAPGDKVRIEHWNVAQNAGRQAALHIATKRKPIAFIPIFWSALGAQLRYCGHTSPMSSQYDDVVIHGKPEETKFIAYYTAGDKIVAVASMQMDPKVMQCAELMRRKRMPSKKEIQDGVNVLDIYVPAGVKIEA